MSKDFEFLTTHEGRFRITTFGFWRSWKVSLLLMFRYGFSRKGTYIAPFTDDAIHPYYIKGELKIAAGYDNWFGYDWFSYNVQTDQFVKNFYEKHCRGK